MRLRTFAIGVLVAAAAVVGAAGSASAGDWDDDASVFFHRPTAFPPSLIGGHGDWNSGGAFFGPMLMH
jgi:hypothetical protein